MIQGEKEYEEALDILRESLREPMGKRYGHVVSCEEECVFLGKLADLDGMTFLKLRAAALLHDITHPFSFEKQLDFCEKNGIIIGDEFRLSPPTVHSITGAYYAKINYPDLVDDETANMIRTHTVGDENMSICQKILCLADYTEKTRPYKDCISLREWLHGTINEKNAEKVIDEALIKYFRATEEHLEKTGGYINKQMIKAREYLEKS